eukprot:gene37678-66062_t
MAAGCHDARRGGGVADARRGATGAAVGCGMSHPPSPSMRSGQPSHVADGGAAARAGVGGAASAGRRARCPAAGVAARRGGGAGLPGGGRRFRLLCRHAADDADDAPLGPWDLTLLSPSPVGGAGSHAPPSAGDDCGEHPGEGRRRPAASSSP